VYDWALELFFVLYYVLLQGHADSKTTLTKSSSSAGWQGLTCIMAIKRLLLFSRVHWGLLFTQHWHQPALYHCALEMHSHRHHVIIVIIMAGLPNLRRRRLDVYHTSILIYANLGCRSETCCTRLAGNTGRKAKNRRKFAICIPSHKLSGYIFATKARIDNRKKTC